MGARRDLLDSIGRQLLHQSFEQRVEVMILLQNLVSSRFLAPVEEAANILLLP